MFRCPGQDQRFWKPGDISEVQCPGCGQNVEFFKDEPQIKCCHCGQVVVNPRIDLGCAQWCQYAQQCLAVSKVHNISIVRDKLIDQMKGVFVHDQKRIEHALSVLNYAEQIQAAEGGDPLVVKAAAILHDIRIQKVKMVLENYALDDDTMRHICKIIESHHSGKEIDTAEFRCVWDADWLVNSLQRYEKADKQNLANLINKTFKTAKGRELARALWINNNTRQA